MKSVAGKATGDIGRSAAGPEHPGDELPRDAPALTLPITPERALKIAAGLYGVSKLLEHCYAGGNPSTVEVKTRRDQCEYVARLFEAAASQPPLPLGETARSEAKL